MRRVTRTGVAYGVGAGAFWGLVFLAPELVREFSPLELTVGRYFFYGLFAAALIAPRWRALVDCLPRPQWWNLAWLALSGNTLYYLLLASAVQLGGIAMTSLVIGFMPVAVTVVGSRDRGAVPLRRLAPSLLLCALGAICIGWQALAGIDDQLHHGHVLIAQHLGVRPPAVFAARCGPFDGSSAQTAASTTQESEKGTTAERVQSRTLGTQDLRSLLSRPWNIRKSLIDMTFMWIFWYNFSQFHLLRA